MQEDCENKTKRVEKAGVREKNSLEKGKLRGREKWCGETTEKEHKFWVNVDAMTGEGFWVYVSRRTHDGE